MPLISERQGDRIELETVDSTSSYVFQNDLPSGTIVTARHQTAGRGQRGRVWRSRPGESLLFSVSLSLSLEREWPTSFFPLIAGHSLLLACQEFSHPGELVLKWPNDLYLVQYGKAGKLAGILLESEILGDKMKLSLGVGLNLSGIQGRESIDAVPPVSLFGDSSLPDGSRDRILTAFARNWNHTIHPLFNREEFIKNYQRVSYLGGKRVFREDRYFHVVGLDTEGRLVVKDDRGDTRTLYDSDWTEVLI